jgi:hypothetical protein
MGDGMPRYLAPGEHYKGKREDCAVVNITVDADIADRLRQHAGGPKRRMLGRFVTRLILDYEARLEERQRMQQAVMNVLGENEVAGEHHV